MVWGFALLILSNFEPYISIATCIKWATCLKFGLSLNLRPLFACQSGEGSGETARMCRLLRALDACLCDKYKNGM